LRPGYFHPKTDSLEVAFDAEIDDYNSNLNSKFYSAQGDSQTEHRLTEAI
jgi:hypothetical protein